MSRKTKARAQERRQHAAFRLIALGLMFAVSPVFMADSIIGRGLKPLAPLGWMIVIVGCVLVWLTHRKSRAGNLRRETMPRPWTGRLSAPLLTPPSSDSVAAEVDLALAEPRTPKPPKTICYAAKLPPEARLNEWSVAVFEAIEWRRFEAVIEAMFAQAGFLTKSQSHGPDEGVDVWLYANSQPDTPVSIVQCKHWKSSPVRVDKIRELKGVMASQNLSRGHFATTSTFTADAEGFAKANGINLLNIERLLKLITKRSAEQQQHLLAIALEGEYWRPTCVNCGTKLIERAARADGKPFWGCSNYPRCRMTLSMREG